MNTSDGIDYPVTRETRSQALLACGVISSALYAAMLVLVPLWWDEYSSASQTVSELSAIDAPTRALWVSVGMLWTLLYAAFGWGIWKAGRGNRSLRVVGALILAQAVFGVFWPPMHQRDVIAAGGGTLTDTLHIVWTAINGLLTLLMMGFAAAVFGKWFRVYSIATIVILLGAGVVTSLDAPRIEANLPTPRVGVWERVNIGVWLVWVAVISLVLLRRRSSFREARFGHAHRAERALPAPAGIERQRVSDSTMHAASPGPHTPRR
ncbi:MAG TPA: DUF998 domain-containing protein [Gemmatimonadales bacterium]|nr:DUF998 domain-containing protein [Gemmatimonadales bacterium]